MVPEGLNILSGGGAVGGIVVAVASFGWWLRRERADAAKNRKEITAENVTTNTYEAQATEIAAVRERLATIEAAYVAQAAQMGVLLKRISELEARLVGIGAHHDNLILCDVCLVKNERVLEAMDKALKTETN